MLTSGEGPLHGSIALSTIATNVDKTCKMREEQCNEEKNPLGFLLCFILLYFCM